VSNFYINYDSLVKSRFCQNRLFTKPTKAGGEIIFQVPSLSKLINIWTLILALAILSPAAVAKASSDNETKLALQEMTTVDRLHLAIGNGARSLADRLDRFFSDEQIEEEVQTTRVRLKPNIQWTEADNLDTSIPFRIDLVLPRLENKWKILVSSFRDKDDDQIPNEVDFIDNDGLDQGDEISTFLGLQYTPLFEIARHIRTSLGPKFKGKSVYFFASARVRFQYLIGPWTANLSEKVFYDNEELGERTSFDFQRPIGTQEVFRSSSSITYSETSKGVDLRQMLLLRHFFSETIAAGLSGEIAAHTRPSMVVDAYVVAFEYRQKIWRDWLYFDLNPQARFPREVDFKFTPFLSVSLETIF